MLAYIQFGHFFHIIIFISIKLKIKIFPLCIRDGTQDFTFMLGFLLWKFISSSWSFYYKEFLGIGNGSVSRVLVKT